MIRRLSHELAAIRASQVLDDGQPGVAPRDQALVHALLSAKEQQDLTPAPPDLSRRVMLRVATIEPATGVSPWRFRVNILQWLMPAGVAALVAVGGVSLVIGTVGSWHQLLPREQPGTVVVTRPSPAHPANVPVVPAPQPTALASAAPHTAPVLVSERRSRRAETGNTIASTTSSSQGFATGSALWSAIERPLVREAKSLTSDTSQVAKMIMETLPTHHPAPDQ